MSAPYFLAVDIGTSRTSAAIARMSPDGSPMALAVPLGRNSDNAPTVAFVAEGDVLFGDAAERRGTTQPDRLIREYKRRIGDDVPIRVAQRAFSPEELYALTVDWAARVAVEREGDTPARLAITVPAVWGEHRSALVRHALAEQGWRHVDVITEPEAAARHYESTNPLRAGGALAVYDFGGGTFDAVVLRKRDAGDVTITGTPVGIEHLGGADFDDAVVRHIVRASGVDANSLAGNVAGRMALAALRRECVEAKESLSFDSEVIVPVILAGEQRTVRLTRDEFELMIADDLERTLAALEEAMDEASIATEDVDAILLTGGTSRIPRVAQLLSERFDRPIAIDADPKAVIALGAARTLIDSARESAVVADDDEPVTAEHDASGDDLGGLLAGAGISAPTPRKRWFQRISPAAYTAGALALVVASAGVAAAPAIGQFVSAGSEPASTGQPAALGDTAYDPFVSEAASEDTATADTPATQAEPPTESADQRSTPRANPRRDARVPASKSAPQRSSTPSSQKPSGGTGGGSKPSGPANQPSNPAPQPSQTTPPGTTEDPGTQPPSTPAPEPEPEPSNPPAPEPEPEPEPEPSNPPAPEPEPEPEPSTSSDPAPSPEVTP